MEFPRESSGVDRVQNPGDVRRHPREPVGGTRSARRSPRADPNQDHPAAVCRDERSSGLTEATSIASDRAEVRRGAPRASRCHHVDEPEGAGKRSPAAEDGRDVVAVLRGAERNGVDQSAGVHGDGCSENGYVVRQGAGVVRGMCHYSVEEVSRSNALEEVGAHDDGE